MSNDAQSPKSFCSKQPHDVVPALRAFARLLGRQAARDLAGSDQTGSTPAMSKTRQAVEE